MLTSLLAVETTQCIIAIGSIGSALIAFALALGLKHWFFRSRVRLVLRHASDPEEISDLHQHRVRRDVAEAGAACLGALPRLRAVAENGVAAAWLRQVHLQSFRRLRSAAAAICDNGWP